MRSTCLHRFFALLFTAAFIAPLTPAAASDNWYAFGSRTDGSGEDQLSLASWLDTPAGRHGRLRSEGERFIYNGRPIRLWGINVTYATCAPSKELADRRAEFYARLGINAVRLHKFADGPGWAGIQSADSFATFDAAALDRFDYFVAALKRRGIYVELSANFGIKLGEADLAAVPYAAEFGAMDANRRLRPNFGALYLSRELQELQFAQMRRLLTHRNPYTGTTYAAETAVALIELVNEDDALFFGTFRQLKKSPTLRARAAAAFATWLRVRYPTDEILRTAWGEQALNAFARDGFPAENWTDGSILPVGSPLLFDPERLDGDLRVARQRLLDTMAFLAALQDDFYARYAAELRAVGYEGEIISSNWESGRQASHYFNLRSDAKFGAVDRHNYFTGASRTMIAQPGSGLLSSGLEQVAGRPFIVSEWLHVSPHPFAAEGPALMAAYGMGLQGWDGAFAFQDSDDGVFAPAIDRGKFEASAPQILGLYPALSRQVLRGDIAESPVTVPRRVSDAALARGDFDFIDTLSQKGDFKTYASDKVPSAAVAVARTVVEYTGAAPASTPQFQPDAHRDTDGALRSVTDELCWHAGTHALDGWFTTNTRGTQGVVGFASGKVFALRDVRIAPHSAFAAIHLTARDRDATIVDARALLLTAFGRARDASEAADIPALGKHTGPVLLEPVKFTLTLTRDGAPHVELLDHQGRATGHFVPVRDGVVEIDTGRDRTPYYRIVY